MYSILCYIEDIIDFIKLFIHSLNLTDCYFFRERGGELKEKFSVSIGPEIQTCPVVDNHFPAHPEKSILQARFAPVQPVFRR